MEPPSARGGRPPAVTKSELKDVLRESENRVMTLGMMTDKVDASSPTVNKRLSELVKEGEVETEKIGNATGYWIPTPRSPTDSVGYPGESEREGIPLTDGGKVRMMPDRGLLIQAGDREFRLKVWAWLSGFLSLLGILVTYVAVFTAWTLVTFTEFYHFLLPQQSDLDMLVRLGVVLMLATGVITYYSTRELMNHE